MTSDHYTILGVTPAAEDVVIRAAYRALMRHYHPDTNPDPQAQAKAREITAAYALLRDPARRAEYDARRAAGDDLWVEVPPPPGPPPPAMRGPGIAAAVLSLALVASLWAWPRDEAPSAQSSIAPPPTQVASKPPAAKPVPIIELEPESERLANLRDQILPAPPPTRSADVTHLSEPAAGPATPLRIASAEPRPSPAVVPSAPAVRVARPPPPAKALASKPAAPPPQSAAAAARPSFSCRIAASPGEGAVCKSERLATLDRLSAGFFSQSMTHADKARKDQLLGTQDRFVALRNACQSESCVSSAYLRHMREIGAIMERKVPAAQ